MPETPHPDPAAHPRHRRPRRVAGQQPPEGLGTPRPRRHLPGCRRIHASSVIWATTILPRSPNGCRNKAIATDVRGCSRSPVASRRRSRPGRRRLPGRHACSTPSCGACRCAGGHRSVTGSTARNRISVSSCSFTAAHFRGQRQIRCRHPAADPPGGLRRAGQEPPPAAGQGGNHGRPHANRRAARRHSRQPRRYRYRQRNRLGNQAVAVDAVKQPRIANDAYRMKA